MTTSFEDETFLVTGGTGNVGPTVTDRLVERGADVVSTYVVEDEFESVSERAMNASDVSYYYADLTVPGDVREVREKIVERHGSVGGIVNLVGGFSMGGLEETDKEDLVGGFLTHAVTVYLTVKEFRSHLEKTDGAVVNFSSQGGLNPGEGTISYSLGKGAVHTLTQVLDHELSVRVNAVAPNVIDTPANRESWPEADFQEWTEPERVMDVVEFLLSGNSSTVSGQTIKID